MKALTKYAKLLIQHQAIDAILKDLRKEARKELKSCKDGQAVIDGVEFHLTRKVSRVYPDDVAEIIADLSAKIDAQKKLASDAGLVEEKESKSFDASIPKSAQKKLFSAVPEYHVHFGGR